MTVVRYAVGVMDGYKMELGLRQESVLSPLLLVMVRDRETDDIR